MASQQAILANTIAGMKRAIKRKAYDSESDSSIEKLTNRGKKLRKKARYVHEGQLAPPSGPRVYKRTIEYAGFQRDVISRNPPLIDEDGYEVDSDDDARAQAAILSAAQFDPYAKVKLDHLLAPLTAASDLPDHPTLSKPFTSQTLTLLTKQAGDMVKKEKASLWKLKHLFTRMSGDMTWIPCHTVEGNDDWAFFFDDLDQGRSQNVNKSIAAAEECQVSEGALASQDAREISVGAKNNSPDSIIAAVKHFVAQENGGGLDKNVARESSRDSPNPTPKDSAVALVKVEAVKSMEVDGPTPQMEDGYPGDQEDISAPRRMRTRAQTQAGSENAISRTRSVSPELGNEPYIHPYFMPAQSSRPDRNVGLPEHEAAETRRVLQSYIQKQEEVCRGVQRIYDGLLKADRCRKLVMKWAKAEGHVGANRDMSDGEDWYDNEEWELDSDLKKGQDEEEEDAASTAKKTRTRRQ